MTTLETVPVPCAVLVYYATPRDHLVASEAVLAELLLIAGHAHDLVTSGDETVRSYEFLADFAAEAFCVPLAPLVFVLLHPCPEDVVAERAPGSEPALVAGCTEELVFFVGERFLYQ